MTNFKQLTEQAVAEVKATTKAKRKYIKIAGETCHERWDREHIEKWQAQIDDADDMLAEYDSLGHDELVQKLKDGNMALHYMMKQKAKAEAMIAKYTDPNRQVNRKLYATSKWRVAETESEKSEVEYA